MAARQQREHQPAAAVLVRKGSDLNVHTTADLRRVQDNLNSRPRPTLNLDTPAQRLAALIRQAA